MPNMEYKANTNDKDTSSSPSPGSAEALTFTPPSAYSVALEQHDGSTVPVDAQADVLVSNGGQTPSDRSALMTGDTTGHAATLQRIRAENEQHVGHLQDHTMIGEYLNFILGHGHYLHPTLTLNHSQINRPHLPSVSMDAAIMVIRTSSLFQMRHASAVPVNLSPFSPTRDLPPDS
jgi:hypothetical protein